MPKSQEAEFRLGDHAWMKVVLPGKTDYFIDLSIMIAAGAVRCMQDVQSLPGPAHTPSPEVNRVSRQHQRVCR